MNDEELIREYVKLDNSLNENEKKKAIKEFRWAIEDSPKIRKCIEDMIEVANAMRASNDRDTMMFHSMRLMALTMRYHSMYVDKRLDRLERHVGMKLEFGDSSI